MFLYLLKVSFVIGAALLFYKTVLQQESFFATNRLYLLGSILLAFALPFVNLPPLVSHQGYLSAVLQQDTPPMPLAMAQEQAPAASALPAFTPPAIAEPEPKEPVGEQLQEPVVFGPIPDKAAEKTVAQAAVPENQVFPWQAEWLYWLGMLYFFGVAVFALNLLVQIVGVLYSAVKSTDKIRDGDNIIGDKFFNQGFAVINHCILYITPVSAFYSNGLRI